jgi:uncharacterized membrane protein YdjX (TVP38/TMEM64 family)
MDYGKMEFKSVRKRLNKENIFILMVMILTIPVSSDFILNY